MLKSFFAGLTAIYLSITGIFHAPKTIPPVIATSTTSEQTTATTSDTGATIIGSVATTSIKRVNVKEKSAPANTTTTKPVQTIAPTAPPISTQPVKQQSSNVSNDEQVAIDFFNKTDSCSGLSEKQFPFCAAYSFNHVSDLVIQRKAQAAAEADRLAAERVAEQKRAQAELDAFKAQIATNPTTCSYVSAEKSLYCDNLNSKIFNIERFSFTLISSDALNKKFSSGSFSPAIKITDKQNKSLFSGPIHDRSAVNIITFTPLPANESLAASNNSLVLHLDFCAGGVGCTSETDFQIVFNSVDGRFADGTSYSPNIQMK